MITTDICIIGAGASSLMCASNISENKKVILIEKDDRIGKKILVTGNGRCNLSNMIIDKSKYNTPLVENYFKKFSSKETLQYFEKLGLQTFSDSENRVYPISNCATSVLDVLRLNIENKKNITIRCNTTVTNISNYGEYFLVNLSNNEVIKSSKIVLGLGGNSNLNFLDNISLPKFSFIPSLGGLKTSTNKGLNNIKVPSTLVTLKNEKINFSQIGEVLFKSDSISGIVIFNLSAQLSRIKNFKSKIHLDFLPKLSLYELKEMLLKRRSNLADYSAETFLCGMFHNALNKNLLEKSIINPNKKINNISDIEIDSLCQNIKNFIVESYDILGNNQVYSGGISLKSISNNFMLKSTPNLYIIGEMLDVDGECGGYNLQWAWTSGYLCSKDL